MTPLRVVAELRDNAPLGAYDAVNLDNLLARAVVNEATHGQGVPPSEAPYALPVPLLCLWRSTDALPLWAATGFRPTGAAQNDTVYLHKRAQSGRFTRTASGKFNVKTTAGRWMERRVPVPVTVCQTWEAFCWGHAGEIARLLEGIAFMGKHRGKGWGEIVAWGVEAWQTARSESPADMLLDEQGRLTRALSMEAAFLLPRIPMGDLALVGWTPPQWKPSLFCAGWRAGTPTTD